MKTKSLITWLAAGAMLVGLASCNQVGPEAPVFKSLTIDTSGAKTSYTVGEEFSADGIKVTVEFENSDPVVLTTADFTVEAPSTAEAGQAVVKLTYDGKSAFYTISVVDKKYELKAIEVDASEARTEFIRGEQFNYEGLVVRGMYQKGEDADNDKDIIYRDLTGYQVSAPDMTKEGPQEVTVSYEELEASYEINVNLAWYQEISDKYAWWVEYEGDVILPVQSLAGFDVTFEADYDESLGYYYLITAEDASSQMINAAFELSNAFMTLGEASNDLSDMIFYGNPDDEGFAQYIELIDDGSDLYIIAAGVYVYSPEETFELLAGLFDDGVQDENGDYLAPGFGYSDTNIAESADDLAELADWFYISPKFENIAFDGVAEIVGSDDYVELDGYVYHDYVMYDGDEEELLDVLADAISDPKTLNLSNYNLVGDPFETTDKEVGPTAVQLIESKDGTMEGRLYVESISFLGYLFTLIDVELAAKANVPFGGAYLKSLDVAFADDDEILNDVFADMLDENSWRVDGTHENSYGFLYYSDEVIGSDNLEGQLSPIANDYFYSVNASFQPNQAQVAFSDMLLSVYAGILGFTTELPLLESKEGVDLYMWEEMETDEEYGYQFVYYTYDYMPQYDDRDSLVDEFAEKLSAAKDGEDNPLWNVKQYTESSGDIFYEATSVETVLVGGVEKQICLQFLFSDPLFIMVGWVQDAPGPFKDARVASLLEAAGFEHTVVPTPAGDEFVFSVRNLSGGGQAYLHNYSGEGAEDLVEEYAAMFEANTQWELVDAEDDGSEYLFLSTEVVDLYPVATYKQVVIDFGYDADNEYFYHAVYVYENTESAAALTDECAGYYGFTSTVFPYLYIYDNQYAGYSSGFDWAVYNDEEAADAYVQALKDSDDWAYIDELEMGISREKADFSGYTLSLYTYAYAQDGTTYVAARYSILEAIDVSGCNDAAIALNGEGAAQFEDTSALGELFFYVDEDDLDYEEDGNVDAHYIDYIYVADDADDAEAFLTLLAAFADASGLSETEPGSGAYVSTDGSLTLFVDYNEDQQYVYFELFVQAAQE